MAPGYLTIDESNIVKGFNLRMSIGVQRDLSTHVSICYQL